MFVAVSVVLSVAVSLAVSLAVSGAMSVAVSLVVRRTTYGIMSHRAGLGWVQSHTPIYIHTHVSIAVSVAASVAVRSSTYANIHTHVRAHTHTHARKIRILSWRQGECPPDPCNTLQHTATHCNTLRHTLFCELFVCNTLNHTNDTHITHTHTHKDSERSLRVSTVCCSFCSMLCVVVCSILGMLQRLSTVEWPLGTLRHTHSTALCVCHICVW